MRDLFNHIKELPLEVQNIILKYAEEEEETYPVMENMLSELMPYGYTFEYYLDAIPYNLRKI